MHILITGASGLLGTALTTAFKAQNHRVYTLTRRPPQHDAEITWRPDNGYIDTASMPTMDIVIHLSGENIASGRWTQKRKKRIRDSRVLGTHLLAQTLAALQNPPQTLICASAIGYYGHRGSEELTEDSSPGTGFLSEVCQAWEQAAQPALNAGIRTVFLRTGMVLAPNGGALQKMLLPFKLGLGGIIGSGTQYISWIALDDLIQIVQYAITTPNLSGPINVVSPNPVTNRNFTKTLGRVLSRPTLFPLPAFAARLALGEMANDLLLASTRVIPAQLQASSFPFSHPNLEQALRHVLDK